MHQEGSPPSPTHPVFSPDASSFLMRKVGLCDRIKIGEQVPTPRQPAFPSGIQGNIVCRWYRTAIVLAMIVSRHDGSHDDVLRYAGITKTECTFDDQLTLNENEKALTSKKGEYVP